MIDKTYIINLSRRSDKRLNMENEVKKFGERLNHIFFMAIDGNNEENLNNYNFKIANWFDPSSGKSMTRGEIGCALSHYNVWKDIILSVENGTLKENCKVLILEDDVIIPDNFLELLDEYTQNINIDYECLYVHRKPLNLNSEIKISEHIHQSKRSYWACGYILTYDGAIKLVNTNYLQYLIPVDEYLPIMYDSHAYGYETYFKKYDKLICYAIYPNLLKLNSNAFYDSETFHSNTYHINDPIIFNHDKEFIVIYLGIKKGNSYDRLISYSKIYGLPIKIIDSDSSKSQILLLLEELNTWSSEKLDNTLLLVIAGDDKKANILPISSPLEIIDKYLSIVPSNDNLSILIADKCNGSDKSLFCGWSNRIKYLFEDFTNKCKNSKLTNNTSILALLSLSEYIHEGIIYDKNCEIFKLIDNENLILYDHKKSRIIDKNTNKLPSILFSDSDILINRIENYTGNNWNEYYGYKYNINIIDNLPTIYISIHSKVKNRFKLDEIKYPKNLLVINIVSNSNNHELEKFIESNCDYYFFIGDNCIINNENIILELLNSNKDVVAPLLRRGNDLWTNFWGDISETGYYKRSFDYIDIINYKRKGCWNVPYITGTFLIKRDVIIKIPNLFSDNSDIDIDMRMCLNLRNNDIFMYINNMHIYGYINENVTIYDIFNHRKEWESKYLHPTFLLHLNNLHKVPITEYCTDIFDFPLFSEDFCKEIIDRMEEFGQWSAGKKTHIDKRLGEKYYENFPTVDIQLFQINMDKQWHEIVFSYIAPMASILYSSYKTKDINLAFVVKYNAVGQESLAPHHDSSTYTVNIALNHGNGIDYDGGGCRFIRQNYILKNKDPGICTMHPGRLTAYHEGLPVTAGTRYILVSFIN